MTLPSTSACTAGQKAFPHPIRGASSGSAPAAEPLCHVDTISTQVVSADTTPRTLRATEKALERSASGLRTFYRIWGIYLETSKDSYSQNTIHSKEHCSEHKQL